MTYGSENDIVMFSEDIAETVQIEYPKSATRLEINGLIFELESLQYIKNNLKKIKVFGNISSIMSIMAGEEFEAQLIINNEQVSKFNKSQIEEIKIDNISTNCNIIIVIVQKGLLK